MSKSSSQCKSANFVVSNRVLLNYISWRAILFGKFYILLSCGASGWDLWSVNHNIVTVFLILNSTPSNISLFLLIAVLPFSFPSLNEYLEPKWKPKYIYEQQNFEMVSLTVLLQMWSTLGEIEVKMKIKTWGQFPHYIYTCNYHRCACKWVTECKNIGIGVCLKRADSNYVPKCQGAIVHRPVPFPSTEFSLWTTCHLLQGMVLSWYNFLSWAKWVNTRILYSFIIYLYLLSWEK